GDLSQAKRISVLRKFKEGSIEVLVATGVYARGLVISGVTHVYNFDIPQDPESYVHRIGRTGRAGKTGMAMTLVTPREIGQHKNVENTTKRKMDKMKPPTLDEALEGQQKITMEKIVSMIESNNLSYYTRIAEELLEEHDSVSVVAAAIKLMTKEPDATPVKLTEEAPLRVKRDHRDNNRGGGRDRGRYKGAGGRDRGRGNSRQGSGGNRYSSSSNRRGNFRKNEN